ncbi:TPA: hypothetical protein HA235_00190 [Candidatus Woesearchaeota archaeon]|nr:hypothetical protein [Candidatus Woesearchaeota archaeon]HIH31104.1 hypothetical protein [Candidatus Woesearchaeota archaeon]HIH55612.1 hypothetical protein [Candidatus Woesearchaeota archaeon]HIJ01199.1 hypothetical protein [Candidatus Woesearchaeota archaeon]HIJ14481.1 hypothetical protein [Candidatus Woesearchaeota archaeon]
MSDNYLANVPEQSMFILANGTRIANLDELFFIVRNSDDSLYTMYVNNEKNDFANWIRYSIHHEQLYNRIKGNIPKKDFIDILAQEIEFIKNPKLRETAQYFSADENSINAQDKSVIKDTGTNLKLGEANVESLGDVHKDDAKSAISSTIPVANTEKASAEIKPLEAANVDKPSEIKPVDTKLAVDKPVEANNAAENTTENKPTEVQQVASQASPVQQIIDEIYEFEEVLKSIIDQINAEIFSD